MTTFRHAFHQGTVAVVLQIQFKPDFIIYKILLKLRAIKLLVKKIFFTPFLSPHLIHCI